MKIGTTSTVDTDIKGSVDFTASSDIAKLFAMLSDYLYTDKERAVLSELSQNAVDAQRLIGNHHVPIKVVIPTTLEPLVKVIDCGPGLSEDDVYRLLTVYGASDKTDSDDFIGGYGIGFKAAAAVTSTWTIISNHDGLCKEYLVFVKENGVPSCKKIREVPSTVSGLEIHVPVNPNKVNVWKDAARSTYEFYDVKPNVVNLNLSYISPQIPFIHGLGFECHKTRSGRSCGQIPSSVITSYRKYAVDLAKVFSEFASDKNLEYVRALVNSFEVIMRFNIGEVSLSLNREQLQYTPKTINAIYFKLVEAWNAVKEKFDNHVKGATDSLNYRQLVLSFSGDQSVGRFFNSEISSVVNKLLIGNKWGVPTDVNKLTVLSVPGYADWKIFTPGSKKLKLVDGSTRNKTSALSVNTSYNYKNYKYEVDGFDFFINHLDNVKFIASESLGPAYIKTLNFNFKPSDCILVVPKSDIEKLPKELTLNRVVDYSTLSKPPVVKREKIEGCYVLGRNNIITKKSLDLSQLANVYYYYVHDHVSNCAVDSNEKMILDQHKLLGSILGCDLTLVAVRSDRPLPKGNLKPLSDLIKSVETNLDGRSLFKDVECEYLQKKLDIGDMYYSTASLETNNPLWNSFKDKVHSIRAYTKHKKIDSDVINLYINIKKTTSGNDNPYKTMISSLVDLESKVKDAFPMIALLKRSAHAFSAKETQTIINYIEGNKP